MINVRSFTFSKSNEISRSEGDANGGGPSTGEELAETGSEAGTFGR